MREEREKRREKRGERKEEREKRREKRGERKELYPRSGWGRRRSSPARNDRQGDARRGTMAKLRS